jgi:hypothetical protein
MNQFGASQCLGQGFAACALIQCLPSHRRTRLDRPLILVLDKYTMSISQNGIPEMSDVVRRDHLALVNDFIWKHTCRQRRVRLCPDQWIGVLILQLFCRLAIRKDIQLGREIKLIKIFLLVLMTLDMVKLEACGHMV